MIKCILAVGINDAKAGFACAKWSYMSLSYELLTLFNNNNNNTSSTTVFPRK